MRGRTASTTNRLVSERLDSRMMRGLEREKTGAESGTTAGWASARSF
jgi:hypothetical protein